MFRATRILFAVAVVAARTRRGRLDRRHRRDASAPGLEQELLTRSTSCGKPKVCDRSARRRRSQAAAVAHSEAMLAGGFFEHDSADGTAFHERDPPLVPLARLVIVVGRREPADEHRRDPRRPRRWKRGWNHPVIARSCLHPAGARSASARSTHRSWAASGSTALAGSSPSISGREPGSSRPASRRAPAARKRALRSRPSRRRSPRRSSLRSVPPPPPVDAPVEPLPAYVLDPHRLLLPDDGE